MDDFGLLARDFGFRPQGKSAPMNSSGSGSNLTRPANDPFDSLFDGLKDPSPKPSYSSMPVYDKPVYDDDIFDGVPGIKSSSAKVEYEDVFAAMSKGGRVDEDDDLLGSLGRSERPREEAKKRSEGLDGFEELIPGFGGSSPPSRR